MRADAPQLSTLTTLQLLTQSGVKPLTRVQRKLEEFPVTVEFDGLSSRIKNHLATVTGAQVLLQALL